MRAEKALELERLKQDSLMKVEAEKQMQDSLMRLKEMARIDSLRKDSLMKAEEIPSGMAVVHHNTKVDTAGTTDSTIDEEQPKDKLDSLLAKAYEQDSAETPVEAPDNKEEASASDQVQNILNIQGRKVLFKDTIWSQGENSEFIYNFTSPATLFINVTEIKGKPLKAFKLDQMKWKTDGTVEVNNLFAQNEKFKTLSDAQVDVPSPGVYRVSFIQPPSSFRKLSMSIEAKHEDGSKYPSIASPSKMYTYEKNESGKTLIGSQVKAFTHRKVLIETLYKGDIFIDADEVKQFDQQYYRGSILNLSCCESGRDYKAKYSSERPIKEMVKLEEGDTVLFMLNEVRDDKGELIKLKTLEFRRFGCSNSLFEKTDVQSSKFAFVVNKTGYYQIIYDTYTSSPYLISGGLSVLAKSGKRPIKTEDLELVYFYEYNTYTKKDDLKFGLAPVEHVKGNMKK